MISLKLPSTVDLLPPTNIHVLEDRAQATSKSEDDIYGSPVVIKKELPSSSVTWTIGAAYVALSVVQACIDAYHANTHLTLTDERAATFSVVINEYPVIERHQSLDQLIYTVKFNLVQDGGTFGLPTVLSTTGSRLFGRGD
jgi:hypothetical protein